MLQPRFTIVLLLVVAMLGVATAVLLFGPYVYAVMKDGEAVPMPPSLATVALPSDTLFIPALGIQAPVVAVTEKNESAYQRALQKGVVQYPGTAQPGQEGNVYIFGHSSDFAWSKGAYKTVFARLPKIKVGDRILVSDHAGVVYEYAVKETLVVRPREQWVITAYGPGEHLLTLQTSYPLGTALKRFIVRAELQNKP